MKAVKEKRYGLINNILYVYKGVAKHKPYLIVLLFLSVVCTAGSRFIWLFLSKYIIEYISNGMEGGRLVKAVVILTVSNVLCLIGQNAVNFGKEPAAFYVRPMFMLERNKKHIGMFYENLEIREVLDVVEKSKNATRNTDVGIEGIIRFTLEFCSGIFTCLVAVVILCKISIYMAIAVLGFGAVSYYAIDKATKREKYLINDSVAYQKRKLEYFKKISNDFGYGKDIRLYQAADRLSETQKELHKELHENVYKSRIQWLKSSVFTNTLDLLREGILYIGLVCFILNNSLHIGDLMLYVGCVHNLADSFQNLMRTFARLRKCSSETNDYRTLNEFCDEQKEEKGAPYISSDYEIVFEDVSFKYPGSDSYVLQNLSITIFSHEKLAIVGLNGAGKTTFVKLLLKLYKPTSGAIYLNGIDINTINTEDYYSLFAPVFQDMECYAFSLAENVSMMTDAKTDRTMAKECLEKAGLGEKMKTWAKGIDTPMLKVLHEDGIVLSGGELQKMALARALYKNAPIIILDEPTAALDAMAESKMYEQFDSLIDGKSAVYISHRLASTRFCDSIAMFENGRIIEYGSHKELMQRKGRYAEMFEMQAHYYKEEKRNEAVVC